MMVNMTKKDSNKRTARIVLRCTPQEHAQIFKLAKGFQISVSQFLLTSAFNAQKLGDPKYHELIRAIQSFKCDLARLGNLYKLGINNQISVQQTHQALEEQIELMHKLASILREHL